MFEKKKKKRESKVRKWNDWKKNAKYENEEIKISDSIQNKSQCPLKGAISIDRTYHSL